MFINILELVYPVGSFYLSNNAISPAESIGGTWTQIENAVLRGATEIGYVGNDTHVQTVEEMPAHTHSALSYSETTGSLDASSPAFLYRDKSTTNWRADTIKTYSAGGGAAMSLVQRSYNCFIWYRTA